MSISDFDPEILQDFITESGELLEQLEGDLVHLESTPEDPNLLNQIFRALHTIKGSASFLALTNLVAIAHVSESALNAARNGQIVIGSSEMDLLLEAIDLLKIQFDEIISGNTDLSAAEPILIESLSKLGEGNQSDESTTESFNTIEIATGQANNGDADASTTANPDGRVVSKLELDSSKLDLVEHLASDIEETINDATAKIELLREESNREAAAEVLNELFEELSKTIDFFDIAEMHSLSTELLLTSENIGDLESEAINQVVPRLLGICLILTEQTHNLAEQTLVTWDTEQLIKGLHSWMSGEGPADTALDETASGHDALHANGIMLGAEFDESSNASESTEAPETQASEPQAPIASATTPPAPSAPAAPADLSQAAGKRTSIGQIEQTIRVEVGRLESLMNLVGELVLQKNRIGALSDDILKTNLDSELIEQMGTTTSILDRVTGDIQLAVMRTRMQPLEKLFGKYPRLIRDLAGKTGKKINLVIEGAETEVDKSVIEELGDPLVHLLRNSGDHGIELPEARIAAGKEETGTIKLIAGHAGSHVRVQIIDDGKGLDRDVIGAKAIERGLTTPEQLSVMTDEDVFRFILEAGFSTAEQVSDLSGRGVGMDVVRTNIESKLKGELTIESEKGKGTTLTVSIPLTVAIMPAMMVAVADEVFAIPLTNITEIVRPNDDQLSEIGNDPVIHLRGQVYPLISAQEVFDVPDYKRDDENFVVVISYNQRVVGIKVSSVIGQQEIVIKPLDGVRREGPVSGATIRNDGSVSLILDIAKLMQTAKGQMSNHKSQETVALSGR
ncbi:MAG: chemotaxis protein CheA [Phycisphaerales bacterium]